MVVRATVPEAGTAAMVLPGQHEHGGMGIRRLGKERVESGWR